MADIVPVHDAEYVLVFSDTAANAASIRPPRSGHAGRDGVYQSLEFGSSREGVRDPAAVGPKPRPRGRLPSRITSAEPNLDIVADGLSKRFHTANL